MKITICDDNAEECDYCAGLVQEIGKQHGLGFHTQVFYDIEKLLFDFESSKIPPDIIVLDIMMPKIDGLDAGRQLRKLGFKGHLLYLTRSSEYAIPAYDVGAFNYILKPSSYSYQTQDAVDEAGIKRFEKVFMRAVENAQSKSCKRVLLNNIREHRNIPINDISYFESSGHTIKVHYGKEETFEFISSLSKLENNLTAHGFIRVHRSFLVNNSHIASFNKNSVVMIDGEELMVSRGKYTDLIEALGEPNTLPKKRAARG